jgi:hypothetical protein
VAYLYSELGHGLFDDDDGHKDEDGEGNAEFQPDLPIFNPEIELP